MENKKKTSIIIVISLFLVLIVVSFITINSIKQPVSQESTNINFLIEENTSSKKVFDNLEKQGIIKNSSISYFYAKLFHKPNFKAGEFVVDPSMNLDEIIDYLSYEKNALENTVTITFKEGEWLKHYAKKISEVTNLEYDDIVNYWNDKDVFELYQSDYPFLTNEVIEKEGVRYLLEGYLFPDTYEFYRMTDLDTVTRKFLDRTLTVYKELKSDFDSSNLSIHEIFTLSSIVQYETSKTEDMELVASVYMNRLNDDYPLQSSVTTCYAIDISEGDDWRKCEYSNDVDSPYNTMESIGLPPSPILNPGLDAIKAALNPKETDYYFFIGDVCSGTDNTYFSRTYDEHQQLIKEYLTCLD